MTHSPMLNAAKAERDRLRDVIAAFFNCGQTGYIPQPVRDKMLDALNPTPPEDVAARDAANESEANERYDQRVEQAHDLRTQLAEVAAALSPDDACDVDLAVRRVLVVCPHPAQPYFQGFVLEA